MITNDFVINISSLNICIILFKMLFNSKPEKECIICKVQVGQLLFHILQNIAW